MGDELQPGIGKTRSTTRTNNVVHLAEKLYIAYYKLSSSDQATFMNTQYKVLVHMYVIDIPPAFWNMQVINKSLEYKSMDQYISY